MIITLTYLGLEIGAYTFVASGIRPNINYEIGLAPHPDGNYVVGEVDYHHVNGYRIVQCPWRYIRIMKGQLVFDNETCMNEIGFRSSHLS